MSGHVHGMLSGDHLVVEVSVRWISKLLVAFACLAASIHAGRVAVPRLGISAYVPAGWVIHDSANEYRFQDTTLVGMRAILGISAWDGVGGTPRNWVLTKTQAQQYDLDNDPFSIVYVVDSMTQGGRFAMYVNWMSVPDSFAFAFHDRYAATANIGYHVYAWGDTADFYENYGVYTALLDSVQFDGNLSGLGMSREASQARGALAGWSQAGGWVEFRGPDAEAAALVVTDLRGREVWKGRFDRQGIARWNSAGTTRGTYLARVLQAGRVLGASSFVLLP